MTTDYFSGSESAVWNGLARNAVAPSRVNPIRQRTDRCHERQREEGCRNTRAGAQDGGGDGGQDPNDHDTARSHTSSLTTPCEAW